MAAHRCETCKFLQLLDDRNTRDGFGYCVPILPFWMGPTRMAVEFAEYGGDCLAWTRRKSDAQ